MDQTIVGCTVGSTFPNFKLNSTEGTINFYEWMQNSWVVIFCYVEDFNPCCLRELCQLTALSKEFEKRNLKVIAASCNSVDSHKKFIEEIKRHSSIDGHFPFPIIADENREMLTKLQIKDPTAKDEAERPLMRRAVYIVRPDKVVRFMLRYPAAIPMSFSEDIRSAVDELVVDGK